MKFQSTLVRIFGALWPLIFVPIVIAAIKTGKFGPYQDRAFEIGEPLIVATLIYAAIYCGFWFMQVEHATSVVFAAILTLGGVMLWHVIASANAAGF